MKLRNVIGLSAFFVFEVIFLVKYPNESRSTTEYLCHKLAPLLCLVFLLGVNRNSQSDAAYFKKIFTGLMFSCIGDVLICVDEYLIPAVVVFGVAHIIYISGFGFKPFKPLLAAFILSTFLGASLIIVPKIQIDVLKIAVPIYMTVLLTMIWRAMARVDLNKPFDEFSRIFGAFGAVCFGASDVILCVDSFISKLPYGNFFILITYYSAQLGIALSAINFNSSQAKKKN